MPRRLVAGASILVLLAAACSQEPSAPDRERTNVPTGGPSATIGDPGLATLIQQQLTCLYVEGLLPNEESSLGKFRNIQSLVAAGDLEGAAVATANLVHFILLKYSQYSGPATINCDPPVPGYTNPVSVAQLKDDVIQNLWRYLGLTGQICEIPGSTTGSPETFCLTEDASGFVYFPPNIFSQFTAVGIEANPPDLLQLQDVFDEYPNRVRIVTVGGTNDFSGFQVKPLVVVCFNNAFLPADQSLVARLLLGARHSTGFQFLPGADYSAYPDEVLQQAVTLCGSPSPSGIAFSSRTSFGRFGNRLLDLLLPRPAQARTRFDLAFGGVGGSTEQFSDFGVVDPGLQSYGGVGGSAEQFAPQASVASGGGRANATFDAGASTVVGTAGETESDAADLPSVTVKTPNPADPAAGTPVEGVEVTFELVAPTGPGHTPESQATLCGGQTTFTTTTDANGVAQLACLYFGTSVGYKKLRATFDPTGLDPLACMINEFGNCTPGWTRNFLVQTTPGAAALIQTFMPPGPTAVAAQTYNYGTGLTAFAEVSPDAQARVTDQFGNVVGAGVPVYWSANTSNGAVLVVGAGTQTTAGGTAQVTSWTLGEGLNQLFASLYATDPPVGFLPAQFTGSTPTGVPVFTCGVGASKIDLGPFTIPAPNASIKSVTLQMSVTGQSSAFSAYQASLSVRLDSYAGAEVGTGSGIIELPGNNGSPTPTTLKVSVPRQTGNHTLWFRMTFSNLPPTRKIQVWYNSSFLNNSPCKDAKVYSPTYPSPSTFKAGLSISATN